MRPAVCHYIVALAGMVGTVCRAARDFLVERELADQMGQDRCVANVASGDLDGPNLLRFFINPEVDLGQTCRLRRPCLRAFHSPSPWTLMPVLSMNMCSGRRYPRYGMLTCKAFCRRESVLKLGTPQSNPPSSSRLSTKPVVFLSAMPNRTFIVRQVWIAASL
jgi:hypothetical protein